MRKSPSESRPAQVGLRYVGVSEEDMLGFLAEDDVPWQSAPSVRGERTAPLPSLLFPQLMIICDPAQCVVRCLGKPVPLICWPSARPFTFPAWCSTRRPCPFCFTRTCLASLC